LQAPAEDRPVAADAPQSAWTQIRRVSDLLGTASGILSIVVLAQQAWHRGLNEPLRTTVKWYASIVDWLFSPVAAYVQHALAWLQRWRPDDFHPSAQWRHYVVIGAVMLGASIRAGRQQKMILAGVVLFCISIARALNGASDQMSVAAFLGVLLATAALFALASAAITALTGRAGSDAWTLRDAGAYIGSIAVVFAGAALFVALSAGVA
jgi:hypothetical protein